MTSISYADSCSSGPSGTAQLAYPTRTTLPSVSGLAAMYTTAAYDCWTGKPTGFADVNGVTTSFVYETGTAGFDRLLQTTRAVGVSGVEARTNFVYNDTAFNLAVVEEVGVAVGERRCLAAVYL